MFLGFPEIFDIFFSPLPTIFVSIHTHKFLTTFFSHFLYFLCFIPSKRCKYNYTHQLSTSFSLKISRFSAFFSTLFHCSSSKFPTTTAQFPFYNCTFPLYNCTNCHQLHVKICPANDYPDSKNLIK